MTTKLRKSTFIPVSFLTVLLLSLFSFNSAYALKLDQTPRIAVISAFQPELGLLLAQTQVTQTEELNGRQFTLGKLKGKDVVLFLSGVSMINATMTVQMALDHFNITHIVFSGIAGGVNPDLNIGDVVIPKQWANYQKQAFAREGKDGWELTPWQTKELGNFDMAFPQPITVTTKGKNLSEGERKFWFPVDAKMFAVAQKVAGFDLLEKCSGKEHCLESLPKMAVGGLGVSGPTFVNNKLYREWVWNNFKDEENRRVDALDMESSAVGTVAYVNKVPYIVFRSLSDLAGGSDSNNELQVFFQIAASNASKVVLKFLEEFSP